MSCASVLIALPADSPCGAIEAILRSRDFDLRRAYSGVEALHALECFPCDLTVASLSIPEMDGLEFLERVCRGWPQLPVILVMEDDRRHAIEEARRLGAVSCLTMPVQPADLLAAVARALADGGGADADGGGVVEIVGASKAMAKVRRQVLLAARCDLNVLVTGETGTGKELVARAIHRRSPLADKPFLAHNCAATAHDLFDSQFFGHRRGSFTGAERDHTGFLDQANGGVLFLDELECMSPLHQAKLLRVLDDGEFRPVGSNEVRCASVRFIAATNRDPAAMIADGTLREDLYYRLRGIDVRLPPLRERPEDVPSLVRHFLGGTSALAPEAWSALARAHWPGNVRELRNAVLGGRAASAGIIHLHHLPAHVAEAAPGDEVSRVVRTLRDVERTAIRDALRDADGNRSVAARHLGIDRSTLRRKLRELGS